jgi:SAM-dependent methyltransferase
LQEVRGKHWDDYWADCAHDRGLFALIAKFYRHFIISPALRHHFERTFRDEPGRVYLHAGCGSGESDRLIGFHNASFLLLDSSQRALEIARRKTTLANVQLVRADLFDPPFRTGSIDGIWNLGVMEHFHESEIVRIFEGFGRILKPGGRCLILWPPTYGLSVMVLRSFLFVVNRFRREPLVLYPDEISRFTSRRDAERLVGPGGLRVEAAHFGARDAFTYVVLIASKPG